MQYICRRTDFLAKYLIFLSGLSFLSCQHCSRACGKKLLLKMGVDKGKLFTCRRLLGVPGPTEFQSSLFSYSGAFEKLLKVAPLSLLQATQQVAQASIILKSNMTASLLYWFSFSHQLQDGYFSYSLLPVD